MEEYKNELKCWDDQMITKEIYHLIILPASRLKKLHEESKDKKDNLNSKIDTIKLLNFKSHFRPKIIKKRKVIKKISKESNLAKKTKKTQITGVLMERLNKIC